MKKLLLLFCLVQIGLLSACTVDNTGATERAQIYADGRVGVAREERISEEERARARIREAEERSTQTQATANAVPYTLMVIVLGVLGYTWLNWDGKTKYARATDPLRPDVFLLPQPNYYTPPTHQIPPAVQAAADQRGGVALYQDGAWVIVNRWGQVLARQRLPGTQQRMLGGSHEQR